MTQPHIAGRIRINSAWYAFYNFCFAWAQRQWGQINGEIGAINSINRY